MARRSYHHGNLREALIAAGLRALAEDGASAFSLRDVARRAGVSAAAPYRHFADKDALFAAIAVESLERLRATMDEALATAPADPLARFRATGVAYVRFAVAHPAHFLALCVPGMSERVPDDMKLAFAERQTAEAAQLHAGQAAGTIAPMPLDALLISARAIVHGLAHMIVQGELGPVDAARAAELAELVTGVLGVGLYPRTPQRTARVALDYAGELARLTRPTPPSSTSTDRPPAGARRRAPGSARRAPARRG
jgi:AcrR family transcriptional regulator